MERIVIFSVLYLYYFFTDMIPLLKGRQFKLLWIYIISICISYSIVIALSFYVELPSPSTLIENIVNTLMGL